MKEVGFSARFLSGIRQVGKGYKVTYYARATDPQNKKLLLGYQNLDVDFRMPSSKVTKR